MTDDPSRQAATSPDNDFTLSIDEAVERYARAGERNLECVKTSEMASRSVKRAQP
jgi:hypothetical protein